MVELLLTRAIRAYLLCISCTGLADDDDDEFTHISPQIAQIYLIKRKGGVIPVLKPLVITPVIILASAMLPHNQHLHNFCYP